MYIANVSESGLPTNPYLDAVKQLAQQEHTSVVPVSAAIEMELADLSDEEKKPSSPTWDWTNPD